jgi:hypothetical protein
MAPQRFVNRQIPSLLEGNLTREARAVIMSAEDWLRATRTEEQRLLDEIAKTTLYRQLDAVRTVIALYQDATAPPKEHSATTVAATKQNGPSSRHSFKAANAFSDLPEAAADATSRARAQ